MFTLAVAGAAAGTNAQKYISLAGIAIACTVLTANLGSRAWKNLRLPSLKYTGFGAPVLAFACAVGTGITVPYLGYREVEMGGLVALEHVLLSSMFCGAIFILSDYNRVQEFILVGSQVRSMWIHYLSMEIL